MTSLNPALLRASWRSWYANDMRIVGPGWLQLVWTFIFSVAVGLGFLVLGLGIQVLGTGRWPSPAGLLRWLAMNVGVALVVGYTIHALFALLTRLIGADRIRGFDRRQRGLFFGGVPLAGLAMGWPLGVMLVTGGAQRWYPFNRPGAVAGMLLLSALISLLFYLHFDAKARQIEAEKRATEAQLRLLQGQIEPHFLFNTLAGVISLIEADPPKARQVLQAFTDYLRTALGALRRDQVLLADELQLAEQYLTLMGARMEDRLRYTLDIDPAARQLAVPPLLLQPLVENAVQHGLEPAIAGGTVTITAWLRGDLLQLQVHDDGQGLDAPARPGRPGNGMALANLRERLVALYGSAASLQIAAAQPGTLATLCLPARAQDPLQHEAGA